MRVGVGVEEEEDAEEVENLGRVIVLFDRVVRARLGNRFGVFSGEDGVFRRGDVRRIFAVTLFPEPCRTCVALLSFIHFDFQRIFSLREDVAADPTV